MTRHHLPLGLVLFLLFLGCQQADDDDDVIVEVDDCNGNPAPERWLGDGTCDDGYSAWPSHSDTYISFACEELDWDHGDCTEPSGDDDDATGCDVEPGVITGCSCSGLSYSCATDDYWVDIDPGGISDDVEVTFDNGHRLICWYGAGYSTCASGHNWCFPAYDGEVGGQCSF